MIKSFLIHLSMNMWEEYFPEEYRDLRPEDYQTRFPYTYRRYPLYKRGRVWSDTLKTEDAVWRRVTEAFAAAGGNQLVVDLGDAVRFRSHPEIAVGGAWSPAKLKDELARCRDLGLEVIPKLNFSTCHDAWLRQYNRMVSTPAYYQVCRDLLAEGSELFEGPRFFHLGMDEETADPELNPGRDHIVVRVRRLWWDDLNFLCDEVRRHGGRPWMWADKLWHTDDEEYRANVSLDVLQSNWFYTDFQWPADLDETIARKRELYIGAYDRLDRMGYEQVAVGSNWWSPHNYANTVAYCSKFTDRRLLGFQMAPWLATDTDSEEFLLEACAQVKAAHAEQLTVDG